MRVVITIVVLIMVALMGLILIATFGSVAGVEFSPDTFRTRSFSYHEIPLMGLQVSKITYSPVTSPVADDLARNNWIPAAPPGPVTWHQVNRSRGSRIVWQGDATILLNYLDVPDYILAQSSGFTFFSSGKVSEWSQFNIDHPALAGILWPEVVELARQELYMYVPEVLELARAANQPAQFQADLDAYLAETYTFVGTTRTELGQYKKAIAAFDAALAHDAALIAAVRGRAKAHEAAGNTKQAEEDTALAAELESQAP